MRMLPRSALICFLISAPVAGLGARGSAACEALLGEEYTDPPEVFDIRLDPSWHVALRGRATSYATKEYVPAGETLQEWTQLVTWNVSFGSPSLTLKAVLDGYLQALGARCQGFKSSVLRASAQELIYEWSDEGCADRAPQQEIGRMVLGVTGYHTLAYSVRGSRLSDTGHKRWVDWVEGAHLALRSAAGGKTDSLQTARLALWAGDYPRARKLLEPPAKAGDATAQDLLAGLFAEGWGVATDKRKAFEWLEKAAQKKNAMARYDLARMYDRGLGVDADPKAALRWYRASAELGETHAQGRVGYMLANGVGSEKNYAEAIRWFEKAAAGGHPHALFWLGRMHEEGWGFPKDLAPALPLYRQAAEAGEPEAQLRMGVLYADGVGVTADPKQAAVWLMRAAMQGNTEAGQLYRSRFAPKS